MDSIPLSTMVDDSDTLKGLVERGDLAAAESLARRMLDAVAGDGPVGRAAAVCDLARVLYRRAAFSEAERLLCALVAALEEQEPPDEVWLATALGDLGGVCLAAGDIERACALMLRALRLREQSPRPDRAALAEVLSGLADLCMAAGEGDEALARYRRAEALLEGSEADRLQLLATQGNRALVHWQRDEIEEAIALAEHVHEAHAQLLPPGHLDRVTDTHNLALFLEFSDPERSEALYREVLALRLASFGEAHPETAATLDGLGALLEHLGRWEEAEPLLIRGLEARQAALGEAHPDVGLSLNNLGHFYRRAGQFERALGFQRRSAALLASVLGESHPDAITAANTLAFTLVDLGAFAEAEDTLLRILALQSALSGEDSAEVASIQVDIAQLLHEQGRLDEAREVLEAALDRLEASPATSERVLATGLSNLGSVAAEQGFFDEALERYEQAAAIWRGQGSVLERSSALQNLAVLKHDQEELAVAEAFYLEALQALRELDGEVPTREGALLGSLAALYVTLGRFAEAEALAQEAVSLCEVGFGDDHEETLRVRTIRSSVYIELGDHQTASELLLEALERADPDGERAEVERVNTLNALATVSRSIGRVDEAIRRFSEVLDASQAIYGPASRTTLSARLNLGVSLGDAGRRSEAREHIEAALAGCRAHLGVHSLTAGCLDGLASVMEDDRGDWAAIRALAEESLSIREALGGADHVDVALSSLSLAQICLRTGAVAEGRERAARALSVDDATLSRVLRFGSEQTRRAVTRDLRTTVDVLLSTVPDGAGQPLLIQALEAVLRRKAVDVEIQCVRRQRAPGSATSEAAYQRWRSARQQLAEAQLARAAEDTIQSHKVAVREAEIQLSRATMLGTAEGLGVSFSALCEAIPASAVLVEWVQTTPYTPQGWAPARYRAFIVSGRGGIWAVDVGEAAPIDAAIHRFRSAVASFGEIGADGRWLHEALLTPLRGVLDGAEDILWAPDGALHLLPMAALPEHDGCDPLARWRWSLLASGRSLLASGSASGGPAPQRPVVVAAPDFGAPAAAGERPPFPPLAGTAAEGGAVAALLGAVLLTGTDATVEQVRALRSPRILHLATHGIFQSGAASLEDPMLRAGLALSGANRTPARSILRGEDVLGMSLDETELVVLSACDTGLGEIAAGEGVLGLRHAFAVAGARGLVMSLWRIHDGTAAQLMQSLYRHLLAGRPCAWALQRAQLEVRALYPHPLFFGPFIYQGRPGAVVSADPLT